MRKIDKMLIIIKAESCMHESSLYWLLYFWMCFKFSIKQSKKGKDREEIKIVRQIFPNSLPDSRPNYEDIRYNIFIKYYDICAWQNIVLFFN